MGNRSPRREPTVVLDTELAREERLGRLHVMLFSRYRLVTVAVALALYALSMAVFGRSLGVSANYLVILPVIAFSFSFGMGGGIVSGMFALPVNLFCFFLLGHPEFSPESKAMAEISGVFFGMALGYLADYFQRLFSEISRRKALEERLKQSLYMKDALLEELHHRVKNNLNVIKSVIKLQANRTQNPEFKAECANVVRRIHSFALVYDLLYGLDDLSVIRADEYLETLARNVISGSSADGTSILANFRFDAVLLPISQASTLGLIVNEVVTNAIMHGLPAVPAPELFIDFSRLEGTNHLVVRDNGPGMRASGRMVEGLGLTIVGTLVSTLKGTCTFRDENGTVFELSFPVTELD